MNVRENLHIIIEKHPYRETLNKILLDELDNMENYFDHSGAPGFTNIHAQQRCIQRDEHTKSMTQLLDWIYQLLSKDFPLDKGAKEQGGKVNANIWVARYNKDQYTLPHGHSPFALYGFVYFIKSPKGASPLVFTTSGKKIKPEEGRVVIFPGNLNHHVPKNKCEDRVIIAGNIGYDLNT
tara:strand:- start:683 stop:1222 length:540 start_codon:yes stop_codon:yes gene_type:complete